MKIALIAGASGLTGSFLLQQLLESNRYDRVKALVRRPLEREHPKLEQVVFDYDNPDPELIEADHVYCCLGTTMKKAGSKEAFRKVDYDYPLQLARMAYRNGAQKFALVSAVGANSRSMFFYNRVKGQLEEAIREIAFSATYILRPSMLLGPRQEKRFGEELGKAVMKPLRVLFPSNMKPVHVSQVAACMADHMNRDEQGVHVIPSGRMLAYPART
jgi:uncharacterized protein YbjT (DUF2867 family)